VASVNPTGNQVITTELEDAQGTFTLTPAPSNSFDARIDRALDQIFAEWAETGDQELRAKFAPGGNLR
jgi:hypothetical protein